MNRDDVKRLVSEYQNWGRWGPDDELGSANLITPDRVVTAARLVRTGRVFSLALPLDSSGPQLGRRGRVNPQHVMLFDGGDIAAGVQSRLRCEYTDDAVYMPLQCSTQWDALAHIFFDGKMYNGYGLDQVTSRGARRNSITQVRDRMVTRGVLLDIARHREVSWLQPGERIYANELEECASRQGVDVGDGDAVLVRTGQLAEVRGRGSWDDYAGGPAPGLALDTCRFFCPRGVAAVATDTWGVEPEPGETEDIYHPLHVVLLVGAGIILGEMFDLEELASDCAETGIFEFLFVAPPLTITGAVGTPVNPQAIK